MTMMMTNPHSSKRAAGHLRHPLFALFSVAFLLIIGIADATDDAGTKYLEEKSTEADVVTLPSGLRYKVVEKGNGAFHPTASSPCVCHYAGSLIDGTEFDSSYSRGKPSTFAPNQVIGGWTQAMQLMVEGDKWELYIPSDLAYGDRGRPPTIPGDSALVFTIEMLEIQGGKVIAAVADDTADLAETNQEDLPSTEPDDTAMPAADADDTELSATDPDNVMKLNSSISSFVVGSFTSASTIFCTLWMLFPLGLF